MLCHKLFSFIYNSRNLMSRIDQVTCKDSVGIYNSRNLMSRIDAKIALSKTIKSTIVEI